MPEKLIIIGSGPAGQRAAVQAAKLGKRVAVIERRRIVGGVCVDTGTIPSKTFREAVSYCAFVEDNYPGGPHRVTTELQFIDIRPYQRAYQVLKTGGT